MTYDDFVELFVAPDVEHLQLSEIASGRWSQSAVTRHNRYRSQGHTVCRLRDEIGDGLRLGHIDRVTALDLRDPSTFLGCTDVKRTAGRSPLERCTSVEEGAVEPLA
jgi:hypothetical protein